MKNPYTLRVFTKEPIREEEIYLECMNWDTVLYTYFVHYPNSVFLCSIVDNQCNKAMYIKFTVCGANYKHKIKQDCWLESLYLVKVKCTRLKKNYYLLNN